MLLFVMLFFFFAGFAVGLPWVSIIPGIYLGFKLIYFIITVVYEASMEKAGYKKRVKTVNHKISDGLFTYNVNDTTEEWVREDNAPTQSIGVSYESFVASKLAKLGYTNIQFTPISGDFGADILATDDKGRKCCIQCKCYQSSVGVSSVQEVFSAANYYGCSVAIVITNSYFTNAAKNLAKKLKVSLIEHYR